MDSNKNNNCFVANNNGFQQISIIIDGCLAVDFSNWWINNGALSVSFEESEIDKSPIFAEPNNFGEIAEVEYWEKTVAKILLKKTVDESLMLISFFSVAEFADCVIVDKEFIETEDWLVNNQKQFTPIILDKIAVIASWHKPVVNKTNVQVDPGRAFGSGSHSTTRMIINWLEQNDTAGKNILDYGCGSGILAICAAKLANNKNFVSASDIDKVAVEITKTNANINNVNINTVMPDKVPVDNDIVLANILLQPIITLKKEFKRILKSNGVLLITGVLDNQFDYLVYEYIKDDCFSDVKIINQDDGWILISAICGGR